jgi:hypothetical protein
LLRTRTNRIGQKRTCFFSNTQKASVGIVDLFDYFQDRASKPTLKRSTKSAIVNSECAFNQVKPVTIG